MKGEGGCVGPRVSPVSRKSHCIAHFSGDGFLLLEISDLLLSLLLAMFSLLSRPRVKH